MMLAREFIPDTSSTPAQDAQARIDAAAATLRMAAALLQARRAVDLTGLDDMLGMLCARVLDLPPEDGRSLRAALIGLRQELDVVRDALAQP